MLEVKLGRSTKKSIYNSCKSLSYNAMKNNLVISLNVLSSKFQFYVSSYTSEV